MFTPDLLALIEAIANTLRHPAPAPHTLEQRVPLGQWMYG